MNLKNIKYDPIERVSQVIIFNDDGEITESDNTIVKAIDSGYNVFNDTMFGGMEAQFSELRSGEELKFDCVNTDFFGKISYYDFIIKRLPEDHFAWIAYDFGPQYDKLFELQQERNIAEISARKAEREVGKLQEEKEVMEKLYQELLDDQSPQYILVKSDNLLVNVDLKDIYYLEAYGDYIKVHTSDKVYITYNTMKNVETSLPENQFFRIHRSYIIRLDKVLNIEQLSVVINDKSLPIGKNYKSTLIEKMGQL